MKSDVLLGLDTGYRDVLSQTKHHKSEAVSMINRMLHRLPETVDDLLDGMIQWPDNQPSDWYYINMQEATNSHDFKQKGNSMSIDKGQRIRNQYIKISDIIANSQSAKQGRSSENEFFRVESEMIKSLDTWAEHCYNAKCRGRA